MLTQNLPNSWRVKQWGDHGWSVCRLFQRWKVVRFSFSSSADTLHSPDHLTVVKLDTFKTIQAAKVSIEYYTEHLRIFRITSLIILETSSSSLCYLLRTVQLSSVIFIFHAVLCCAVINWLERSAFHFRKVCLLILTVKPKGTWETWTNRKLKLHNHIRICVYFSRCVCLKGSRVQ